MSNIVQLHTSAWEHISVAIVAQSLAALASADAVCCEAFRKLDRFTDYWDSSNISILYRLTVLILLKSFPAHFFREHEAYTNRISIYSP